MSKIKGILLKPAKSDPHGLLKEGPSGHRRTSAALWLDSEGRREWFSCGSDYVPHSPLCWMYDPGESLVLAWNGKPVREGCFRAVAALDSAPRTQEVPSWELLVSRVDFLLRQIPREASVRGLLKPIPHPFWGWLRRILGELGTIVLIDEDGKEITDAS